MLLSYKWFHIPLEANYHVPMCLAFIAYYYYHWPALCVECRRVDAEDRVFLIGLVARHGEDSHIAIF